MTESSQPNSNIRMGGGEMFDRIAPRYDMMNRLISLGLDGRWRRKLVESLAPIEAGDGILDVATGTADVALQLAEHYKDALITGLDPSPGMLGFGREKADAKPYGDRITLVEGDAQNLPFEDNTFAGITISFGIRNVPDRAKGLSEMVRVLRPGGALSVLELGEPREGILAPFARIHVHHIVPFLGSLVSGSKEYRYLQQSIEAFPPAQAFGAMMTEAGLESVSIEAFSFGACHLYVGRKSRA